MADLETEVKTKKKLQPATGRRQAHTKAFNQVQNQAQNQDPAQERPWNEAQNQELAQDKVQNQTQNQELAQDKSRNQLQNQSQSEDPWASLSLEEGMEKLDELLVFLEDPNIPLEKAFALYQQGVGLLKHCNGRIDTVEKKILMLNCDGGLDEF